MSNSQMLHAAMVGRDPCRSARRNHLHFGPGYTRASHRLTHVDAPVCTAMGDPVVVNVSLTLSRANQLPCRSELRSSRDKRDSNQ